MNGITTGQQPKPTSKDATLDARFLRDYAQTRRVGRSTRMNLSGNTCGARPWQILDDPEKT
jgi:hypothetical protein